MPSGQGAGPCRHPPKEKPHAAAVPLRREAKAGPTGHYSFAAASGCSGSLRRENPPRPPSHATPPRSQSTAFEPSLAHGANAPRLPPEGPIHTFVGWFTLLARNRPWVASTPVRASASARVLVPASPRQLPRRYEEWTSHPARNTELCGGHGKLTGGDSRLVSGTAVPLSTTTPATLDFCFSPIRITGPSTRAHENLASWGLMDEEGITSHRCCPRWLSGASRPQKNSAVFGGVLFMRRPSAAPHATARVPGAQKPRRHRSDDGAIGQPAGCPRPAEKGRRHTAR